MTKSRLNKLYRTMKQRCCNSKRPDYKYYGGRGITICSEWLNSENACTGVGYSSKGWLAFKKWALENGYADNLTIDRIDTNKGYSPENCRWVSMKVQCNNTRQNQTITYRGKTQTLMQWCEELNLIYNRTRKRIFNYHWDVQKAFETK